MTSITHSALPGAVPAHGPTPASASPAADGRLRHSAGGLGTGSKAVRMGLGVAIAAVLAGDVYAILRSPASEGRGAGSSAVASAALPADTARPSFVATDPFGEAAWNAELASRFAPAGGSGAAALGAGGAPAAAVAAPSTLAAPGIALPATALSPSLPLPTNSGPTDDGSTTTDPNPPTTPPPAESSPLDPVVAVIAEVPVVGEDAAAVVDSVASALPSDDGASPSAGESSSLPLEAPAPLGASVPRLSL